MARSSAPERDSVQHKLTLDRRSIVADQASLAAVGRLEIGGLSARWLLQALAVSLGVAGLVAALALIVRTGPSDYTFYLRPVAEAWLAGSSRLYDSAAAGLYNPPWSLLLTLPTVLVPAELGQALINALSAIGIVLALSRFGKGLPRWIWALAATPFFVFMLFIRGNLDGAVLLGICLSWWGATERRPWTLGLGLWLVSLKPINALPLLPFVVFLTWRWSRKQRLKALVPLLASLLIAFPVSGFDWPMRYVRFSLASPPAAYLTVNLWKFGQVLDLPISTRVVAAALVLCATAFGVRQLRRPPEAFGLAMAAWLLVTPYAQEIHYILLTPALLTLARHRRPAVGAAYLCSFLPLLRIPFGYGINYLDLAYPTVLWVGLLSVGLASWPASIPLKLKSAVGA